MFSINFFGEAKRQKLCLNDVCLSLFGIKQTLSLATQNAITILNAGMTFKIVL